MVLTKKKIIRYIAFTLFVLLIQICVAIYLLRNVDFDYVDTLEDETFFLFLLFTIINLLFRYVRWNYILPRRTMKRRYHLLIYLSGFSLTLVPGRIGEMVRVIFLKRNSISYKNGVEATIIDRSMDLIGIISVLSVLLLPFYDIYLLFLIVLLAVFFTAFFYFFSKKNSVFNRFLSVYLSLLKTDTIIYIFSFSVLAWLAQGLAFYFLFSGIVGLGVFSAIKYYLLSLVAGAISLMPGGIGIGELTIFSLLNSSDIDSSLVSLLAIVARGVPLWFAIFCGLLSAFLLIINWEKTQYRD